MLTTWAFDHIENKHNLYRGKDCMKNFCETLREHLKNVIDFENKMLPWTEKGARITLKCNRMLHLWKKIHKKTCKR